MQKFPQGCSVGMGIATVTDIDRDQACKSRDEQHDACVDCTASVVSVAASVDYNAHALLWACSCRRVRPRPFPMYFGCKDHMRTTGAMIGQLGLLLFSPGF